MEIDIDTLLWQLQTQLNLQNLSFVTEKLNKLNIKTDLKKFLETLEFKKNSINLKKDFNKNILILNKFKLEEILQKPFCHPSLLALEYQGNLKILTKPIVAIIGSRKPTYYGREQAHRFAKFLAQSGATVLSGGAIGIDSIANRTAYENGSTIAVVGSGLKTLYPPSNIDLFKKMATSSTSLLLSEFHSYETPKKWNFPRRNLTIAALADFVLVIEATSTSGSLITASAAIDIGVDVGALPGDIENPNSKGTNNLIQNGAFCIQSPQDVLDCIQNKFNSRQYSSYLFEDQSDQRIPKLFDVSL